MAALIGIWQVFILNVALHFIQWWWPGGNSIQFSFIYLYIAIDFLNDSAAEMTYEEIL